MVFVPIIFNLCQTFPIKHLQNPKMFTGNENNKEPRTEPWGTPNRSLQTSDKVEPIFID